jgi:hypothetical protein
MTNRKMLKKIKSENKELYDMIISHKNSRPESHISRPPIDGWGDDTHKIYFGDPRWLVNITVDELRIRAREYEKPKLPEPIIINNIPIHKNQNIELLEGEIFKKNKEKNVDVSNLGRIKYEDNILEQYDPKNNGYLYVNIKSIRKNIPEKVYRLVAETWIDRPDKSEFPDEKSFYYNTVHHVSNNGYDNRIENLTWVTEWQHAMIHPWIDIKKFSFDELDCLLRSY